MGVIYLRALTITSRALSGEFLAIFAICCKCHGGNKKIHIRSVRRATIPQELQLTVAMGP